MTDYKTRLRALELMVESAGRISEIEYATLLQRAGAVADFLGVRDVPISQTVRDAIALAIQTLDGYGAAGYAAAEAMNALSEALALIDGDCGALGSKHT